MLAMGKSLGKGAVWAAMGEQQGFQREAPRQATQHRCGVRAAAASFCQRRSLRPNTCSATLSSKRPGSSANHHQRPAGCTSTANAAWQAAPAPPAPPGRLSQHRRMPQPPYS